MKSAKRGLMSRMATGIETLIFACLVTTAQADWKAGRDLATNEQPDGPQELVNPNAAVPEWSYGYRTSIASTDFTLLPPANHGNDVAGQPDFDGWPLTGNISPDVLVNAGANPIIFNFGFGPLLPLDPQRIYMHPALNANPAVVRWTAPATSIYHVTSDWLDLDSHGGNGASADIVVNGISVFHQEWDNGGSAADERMLSLAVGNSIDFVLGARGGIDFDATSFDATIVAVPEAGTLTLATLALLGSFIRGRTTFVHA